mmetsp:Transcript_15050/g.38058  ORF Transcript_15050/g.38058 Transcript_15050/m.38058 type:complete len:206 (+) Transcript_15050:217-834(+)
MSCCCQSKDVDALIPTLPYMPLSSASRCERETGMLSTACVGSSRYTFKLPSLSLLTPCRTPGRVKRAASPLPTPPVIASAPTLNVTHARCILPSEKLATLNLLAISPSKPRIRPLLLVLPRIDTELRLPLPPSSSSSLLRKNTPSAFSISRTPMLALSTAGPDGTNRAEEGPANMRASPSPPPSPHIFECTTSFLPRIFPDESVV